MTTPGASGTNPKRTPFFEAAQGRRYHRQELIREYQTAFRCRLVVLAGEISPYSVTFFEDTLYEADPSKDLHVILNTPGGDGETALRLVRQAQARCRELTVIVPDRAKSAGTLFVLGAHSILMGPSSDLGPVDPQIPMPDQSLVAAKTIIAAVENAEERIRNDPNTFPLYASLLADVSGLQVQAAREAIERSNDLIHEALASCTGRGDEHVEKIAKQALPRLVEEPQSHATTISAHDAEGLGMPVAHADPAGEQWDRIWRLWVEYVAIPETHVYEGERASHVF